jgi:hypothetical protein
MIDAIFSRMGVEVLLILCFAILSFWQFKRKTKEEQDRIISDTLEKIKAMLKDPMYKARENFGDNEGIFKKSSVVNFILNSQFYIDLPRAIKLLIPTAALEKLIDDLYDEFFKNKK